MPILGMSHGAMESLVSELFPLLYGACFLLLLWQAFRIMARGFRAMPRSSSIPTAADDRIGTGSAKDRTGRLTVHPELLDAEGRLTEEDLLTVRFSGDQDHPVLPGEGN